MVSLLTCWSRMRTYLPIPKIISLQLALLCLVFIFLRFPEISSSYHTNYAGKLFNEVAISNNIIRQNNDAANLERSIENLKKATYWKPNNLGAIRLTSKVFIAREDWYNAVQVVDKLLLKAAPIRFLEIGHIEKLP